MIILYDPVSMSEIQKNSYFQMRSEWPKLLEETGYEKRQTSMIKTYNKGV